MALQPKSNTEDLIKRIEKKSAELIQIVRGKDRGPDARYPDSPPSVFVHDRELRIAGAILDRMLLEEPRQLSLRLADIAVEAGESAIRKSPIIGHFGKLPLDDKVREAGLNVLEFPDEGFGHHGMISYSQGACLPPSMNLRYCIQHQRPARFFQKPH